MKKVLLMALTCALVLFGLTGCAKNDWELGEESPIDPELNMKKNGVLLMPEDSTNTSIKYTLTNEKYETLEYDDSYEIEKYKKKKWYKINVQQEFDGAIKTLKRGESALIDVNWENPYGELKWGQYRFLQKVTGITKDGERVTFYVTSYMVM